MKRSAVTLGAIAILVVGFVVVRSLVVREDAAEAPPEPFRQIMGALRQGMNPAECEALVGQFGIANVPVFRPIASEWSHHEFWFVPPVELGSVSPGPGLQAVTQIRKGESIFVFPGHLAGSKCSGKVIETPDPEPPKPRGG